MGCLLDTHPSRVSQLQTRDPGSLPSAPYAADVYINSENCSLGNEIFTILRSIKNIPKPQDTEPVVCYTDFSAPLAVSHLCLEDGELSDVILPFIGISHTDNGRCVALGTTDILLQCTKEKKEFSRFFENIVKWCSGTSRGRISITIVGYNVSDTETIKKNLSDFGFRIFSQVKKIVNAQQISQSQVVICPSDFVDSYGILSNFVFNTNGGLICTLQNFVSNTDTSRYNMNDLLGAFGLGFPVTNLNIGPIGSDFISASTDISMLKSCTFKVLCRRLISILEKSEIELNELDSIVTELRYNALCMKQSFNEDLIAVERAAFSYLKSHNYETNEGYCPDVIHSVLSVLLCEIRSKMAAECFQGVDLSNRFPGRAFEEPDDNDFVDIHLTLQKEGWISTGYWVTAGVISNVSVESVTIGDNVITRDEIMQMSVDNNNVLNQIPQIVLQIGMHTEALFTKEGPWKRWPVITSTFELKEDLQIANPFGGILYIVMSQSSDKPFAVDLKIDHVFPYPRFDFSDPEVWEATRERGAPWSEVVSKYATFVAPVRTVRAAKNLNNSVALVDELIEMTLDYLSDTAAHNYICVFDVELLDGPVCGYPIIMSINDADQLLNEQTPTEAMFVFITFIGMLALPEGVFDSGIESSLACAAACAVFLKKWPNSNPLDFSHNILPPQFNEIWDLIKNDNGESFKEAMKKVRALHDENPDPDSLNGWHTFINEIMNRTGLPLENLLDAPIQSTPMIRSKQAGRLSSSSLLSSGFLSSVPSTSLKSFQAE